MDVEVDRLSDLQDDLILQILSFADLKDAIGTSMLSTKWRYMWTSIPHLSFSSEDFPTMDKLSDFVMRVLSRRNNQAQLSSFKLYLRGKDGRDVAQNILNQAFLLNAQQINVTCSFDLKDGFTLFIPSSQDLKHLTLGTASARFDRITLTSTGTGEFSSLTTLHLESITLSDDGFFSKCPTLETLTLVCCKTPGSKGLKIVHPQLSNLTINNTDYFFISPGVTVSAPQLRNLSISQNFGNIQISAPQLSCFLFKGSAPTTFSTEGFHSLEKAELCIHPLCRTHAPLINELLHKFPNVKHLSVSEAIIEVLNSSLDIIIFCQSSPFANLKSLNIIPETSFWAMGYKPTKIVMSTQAKSYLLKNSPKATITEVMQEQLCDSKPVLPPLIFRVLK